MSGFHDDPIRYMVFSGVEYYPRGGALDYVKRYSDLTDTLRFGMERLGLRDEEWVHVLDVDTHEIIWGAQIFSHPSAAGERYEDILEWDQETIDEKNAEMRGM